MKRKIFHASFAAMLFSSIITLLLITVVLNGYFTSLEKNQIKNEAELAAAGVEQNGLRYLQHATIDDYRLTWIDKDGTVLYDSEADPSKMDNHAKRSEVKEALLSGKGEAERTSSTLAAKTYYYALRIDNGSVIRISFTRSTIWLLIVRLLQPILWILIAIAVISFLLSQYLSEKIASPINRLDLDHPSKDKIYPEIQPLLRRIEAQNHQIDTQIKQLDANRREFEKITSNMREGVILLNQKGEILLLNPGAARLFSLDDSIIGKDIRDYLNDDRLRKVIAQVLQGNTVNKIIEKNDQSLRIDASPVLQDDKQIGASILGYDVTKEHALEVQRQEFSANVSHELKTPLQSIMGSAELLENHLVKKEDEEKFYVRIRQESSRLLSLIDDIIRISELDGDISLKKEKINLADCVSETAGTLMQAAEKRNVTVHLNLQDVFIQSDDRLIHEIIYNLMDNAIRYNHDPGSVTISTFKKDGMAWLQTEDTGIGIPADEQQRIFERFYRVDKSRSRATGGTGLGLSIVKHAVLSSGGKINLKSELGHGSQFTVTWPAV